MHAIFTDISKFDLFEPILDFKIGDEYVDLHNDFNCVNIEEFADKQNIVLYFTSISSDSKKIAIRFDDAKLATSKYKLTDKKRYTTLSNFHHGKFENKNSLNEKNEQGQKYFYLDFFEGQHLEIFAKQAFALPV